VGSYLSCEFVGNLLTDGLRSVTDAYSTGTHTVKLPICPRWRGGAVWRETQWGYDIHTTRVRVWSCVLVSKEEA
jgi:hypothetical protein